MIFYITFAFLSATFFISKLVANQSSLKSNKRALLGEMPINHNMIKLRKSSLDITHKVIFSLQLNNIDILEQKVLQLATPNSPTYQQWMTTDEVNKLTSNPLAIKYLINWLHTNDIYDYNVTRHPRYITAYASIHKWQHLFNTTFHEYTTPSATSTKAHDTAYSSQYKNASIHRSNDLSLPSELSPFISNIFYTYQPAHTSLITSSYASSHTRSRDTNTTIITDDKLDDVSYTYLNNNHRNNDYNTYYINSDNDNDSVNIPFLNAYYNITSNQASPNLTQAVFATRSRSHHSILLTSAVTQPTVSQPTVLQSNGFSQEDSSTFQQLFHIPKQTIFDPNNRNINSTQCREYNHICNEGNLDLQYITGMAVHT